MNSEDIIYLLILCFCILFGLFYKRIENAETKKIVGSIIGFCIVVIVSGFHTLHLLVSTLINGCLILYGDKR